MKRLNRHKKAAFTLIEMIVLIIIIAVMAGVAVPAYQRLRTQTVFQQSVQETLGLLAWAREAAIASNADAVVRYDSQSNTFTVTVEQPDTSGTDQPTALQDAKDAPTPPQPHMSSLGDQLIVRDWATDPSSSGTNQNASISGNGSQEITFHDDGTADGARFTLYGVDENRAIIEVASPTGRARESDETR